MWVWERYKERELLLVTYLLPGARCGCQRLHSLASRIVRDDLRPLIGCVSLARLSILTGLYIWPRGSHITWSRSGYTPARPAYPDALPSPCLLITTWKLVKAHGVIRNEPKIHVNSHYITFVLGWFVRCEVSDLIAAFSWHAFFQDLYRTARNILLLSHLAFSSSVLLDSRWCNHTIVLTSSQQLSERSDICMTNSLSIAAYAFRMRILISLSVDEIFLPRSTVFRGLLFYE